MNTPAHLILAMAAFGKPGRPRVTAAALAGGLVPDLSLYALAGGALALGETPERVFRELYFSEPWQAVFRIDNSVFVWSAILAVGLVGARSSASGRPWPSMATALGAAGLLHLALDLPLHHDDGRAHFWPLTDWVFASPLSYWDPAHGGAWVGAVEVALCLAATVRIWRRFPDGWARVVTVSLLGMEVSAGGVWALVFA